MVYYTYNPNYPFSPRIPGPAVKTIVATNGVELVVSLLQSKRDEEVLVHLLRTLQNIVLTG